jgi:hypothetical protein
MPPTDASATGHPPPPTDAPAAGHPPPSSLHDREYLFFNVNFI